MGRGRLQTGEGIRLTKEDRYTGQHYYDLTVVLSGEVVKYTGGWILVHEDNGSVVIVVD